MAGTDPRFDTAQFQEAIRFAMAMGKPDDPALQPTFIFRATKTYEDANGDPVVNPRVDANGNPIDFNIRVVDVRPSEVKVECAVEFTQVAPRDLPQGSFRPTKAVVTLLDDEYQLVKEAVEVRLGGDRYLISYEQPTGLFDETVHQIVCFALDEK